MSALKACVEAEVAAMNEDIEALPTRGPCSTYVIQPPGGGEPIVGKLSFGVGDHLLTGIACDLKSPAFALMCDAIEDVKGKAEPYSPRGHCRRHQMQSEGFDIQLIGFGLMSTYHADNEYCSLSDMKDAAKILSRLIAKFG